MGAGIKQAVSDSINSGYKYDAKWYDPESKVVKRLMYGSVLEQTSMC